MPVTADRAVRLPLLAAALAALLVAPASAEDENRPYAPIPAEIGKAVAPSNELLIAAKVARDAAVARNGEAIFAMIADEVTLVNSGITVTAARSIEKKGPFKDADDAFSTIGGMFQEGDIVAMAKASGKKLNLGSLYAEDTMRVIASSIDEADWGRDPLVKGGFCTYRAARWDPKAAEKARASGSRGYWVDAPTKAFGSAAPGARTVATLKPGHLYLQGFMDDLPEGWRAVRLPGGGVGAVPEKDLKDPTPWGICFLPNVDGGWLISAFATSLL